LKESPINKREDNDVEMTSQEKAGDATQAIQNTTNSNNNNDNN